LTGCVYGGREVRGVEVVGFLVVVGSGWIFPVLVKVV